MANPCKLGNILMKSTHLFRKCRTYTSQVPLSQVLPSSPIPKYIVPQEEELHTRVTTLSNGLRVASENKFGSYCTVGVVIDSGSRYEAQYPSGISHFLEKLAFSKTKLYENRDAIQSLLELHGGICDGQSSRDTLIYAASANSKGLDKLVELMAEVTLHPLVTEQEIADAANTIVYELEQLNMAPDPEPLLHELIHAAAYNSNTLGLPKLCPLECASKINREVLFTYLKNHHQPQNMVVAGVGIDHSHLVSLTEKYFCNQIPTWDEGHLAIDPNRTKDLSVAQYTGGLLKVEKDLSNVSLGPNPMPHLAHCVVALESCSHQDPDFVPFCVLNAMMGGGGSFSAGGPGKGMYTRLYTHVLNRYHWIHSATAYHHAYGDSGIFCIASSSSPSDLHSLVEVIIHQLASLKKGVPSDELARAKTQLQSMLFMNLEARPVMFEDVGRQVLANGKRLRAQDYFNMIGTVTHDDIQRVVERMLRSPPSVAAYGELKKLPDLHDVSVALHTNDGRLKKKALFS